MNTIENYEEEYLKFSCSFGYSGFECEIKSVSEIDYDFLSEGIAECLCHEFDFEDEAKKIVALCCEQENKHGNNADKDLTMRKK